MAVPVGATTGLSTLVGLAPPAAVQAPVLTLDEGLKLKAILGTTPDPGGEFTHAGGLMLFANAVQCFRPLNADRNNAAEPQGVAQWLDAMLDPLAQRRDLPRPEARALKTELVAALQPDLNARQNSMVRWDVEQTRALAAPAR